MHMIMVQLTKGGLTPHYDNEAEEEDNDEAAGAIALLRKGFQVDKLT